MLPAGLLAQGKPKPNEPYALVTGTVFRDPGFSLPGAKVILSLKSNPDKKLQEQTSSPRGEFAFRVPPGENQWLITVSHKGFVTAQKEVEIQGQEQIHATLTLYPESKEER